MIASQTIKRPAQTLLIFRLRPPTAGKLTTVSIPNGNIAIIAVVAAGTPRHIATNHIQSANNPVGMISIIVFLTQIARFMPLRETTESACYLKFRWENNAQE